MTIIANVKDEKGNPIKLELKQPAFLVGNGINLADGCEELRWDKLLVKVLFGEDKDKNEKSKDVLEEEFKGLNYPEIAELAEWYRKNGTTEKDIKIDQNKTIKNQICDNLDDKGNKTHKQFIDFCMENDIPVLTTNFDQKLLSSLKTKKKEKVKTPFWFLTDTEKNNYRKIPYHYPFRAYFAEKEFDDNDEINKKFAVWYIHGTKRYVDSIRLNNVDYARNIAEIDKLIRYKKQIGTNWIEKHSWIDIFMRNDLVIMGLGLDSSETDIRWLLRERYVYQKSMNQRENSSVSTIYIYDPKDGIAPGKRKLFEALGIKCVEMKQNEIYSLDKYLSTK